MSHKISAALRTDAIVKKMPMYPHESLLIKSTRTRFFSFVCLFVVGFFLFFVVFFSVKTFEAKLRILFLRKTDSIVDL